MVGARETVELKIKLFYGICQAGGLIKVSDTWLDNRVSLLL